MLEGKAADLDQALDELIQVVDPAIADPGLLKDLMDKTIQPRAGFEAGIANGNRGRLAKRLLMTGYSLERYTVVVQAITAQLEL